MPDREGRRLDFASYTLAASGALAVLSLAIAVGFGVAPGRGNAVLVLGLISAACAAGAAWRVRAGDIGFATGALAYTCSFSVGLEAVLALVTPVALGLVPNLVCAQGVCAAVPAVAPQQQLGYDLTGGAAALGLVSGLLGVYFIASERARRRRV